MAKANLWEITDTETRKLGERSRLETCVVLTVNVCLLAAFFLRLWRRRGVAKITR